MSTGFLFLFVCILLFGRRASTCYRLSINPTCCNAVILPTVTRDVNVRFRTVLSGHAIAHRWRSLRCWHHHESDNVRLSFPIDWYVCDIFTYYYYCTYIYLYIQYLLHNMLVSPIAQLVTLKPSDTLGREIESRGTSGERLNRWYTKFDFTVDEVKERLNHSREKN